MLTDILALALGLAAIAAWAWAIVGTVRAVRARKEAGR